MMSDKGLDVSANDAVLVERMGKFFIYEPRLGVIASDESIERAYTKFVGAKREHLDEVARAGLATAASGPAALATAAMAGRAIGSELGLFLAKTCIVLLVVAGIVYFGVQQAVSGIGAAIAPLEGLGELSLADVVAKAQAMAIDARELPPDRKELLRQSIGELSRELGPILDAWRTPPTAAANPRQ